MPKLKNKQSYYAVLSKDKNYLHGAFSCDKEGLAEARKHRNKLGKKNYKIVKFL
jgi:hypothetical protein